MTDPGLGTPGYDPAQDELSTSKALHQRHLESQSVIDHIKGQVAALKLSVPFRKEGAILPHSHRYLEESAEVNLKNGSVRVSFSYETPSEDSLPKHIIEALDQIPKGFIADDFSNIRILKDLTITNEMTKESFNLSNLLPQGYVVILQSHQLSSDTLISHAHIINQLIYINDDLSTPRGIMIFLHELGHAIDYEKKSPSEKERWLNNRKQLAKAPLDITDADLALHLNKERNAWAFALSQIRPFVNKQTQSFWLNRNILRNFIHNDALASYTDYTRETMRFRAKQEQLDQEIESWKESHINE